MGDQAPDGAFESEDEVVGQQFKAPIVKEEPDLELPKLESERSIKGIISKSNSIGNFQKGDSVVNISKI